MNRASCARRSWRSSVGSPVTVASAAYTSAYQLIWLSRIVGQRQKRERATRWMRSAISRTVRAGSPSSRRACQACTSPSTISASNIRCCGAWSSCIALVQPGACGCEPEGGCAAGRSMKTGDETSALAIDRARASLRAGPRWPAWAATLCVSSRLALIKRVDAALAGPVEAAPLVPQAIEPFLHPIGVGEIARVVVPNRGSRCCCDDEQPRQEGRGERTRAASKRRHEEPPGARRPSIVIGDATRGGVGREAVARKRCAQPERALERCAPRRRQVRAQLEHRMEDLRQSCEGELGLRLDASCRRHQPVARVPSGIVEERGLPDPGSPQTTRDAP